MLTLLQGHILSLIEFFFYESISFCLGLGAAILGGGLVLICLGNLLEQMYYMNVEVLQIPIPRYEGAHRRRSSYRLA